MAGLDNIFTKSNLEESKKKAKMLFGRVLIYLRKNNHIKLYTLLESVEDTNLIDGELKITMSDKTSFDMLGANDRALLLKVASEINSEVSAVDVECNGKEKFDKFAFEARLKKEFGKILTIKRN